MTREEYLHKLLYDHNMGCNHTGCLVVDHDHKTGKVRGLLCHNCNRALGLLHDDQELMQKASEYVKV